MTEANLILRGLEELFPENRFIESLLHCMEKYPDANWGDAMSRGQMRSKIWLIHELIRYGFTRLGTTCICGGWYGILARLILDSDKIHAHHVVSIDWDVICSDIARELNESHRKDDRFLDLTVDMCNLADYQYQDTIINTSCEHLTHEQFQKWWGLIPNGKLVVLQSNDFFDHHEHKNCVFDENELRDSAPMATVHYCGVMPTHSYNRFMVIGTK
jgi:hypothetical protein